MVRVLHVIAGIDPRYGGPSTALLGLAEAQLYAGINVSIVATHHWPLPPMPALDRMRSHGAQIDVVPCRPMVIGKLGRFSAALRAGVARADVVHIHALWNSEQYHAAQMSREHSKPYLFRPCGMLAPWSLRQSRWKKRIYYQLRLRSALNSASAVHFTSEQERESAVRLKIRAPSIVEPNGINWTDFESLPPKGSFRRKYPEIGDRPIILFLGRIHPKKGLTLLVQAIAALRDREAALVIAGPDERNHVDEIRRLAANLGVLSRITFTGELQGVERWEAFRDADIFVLPSAHENFGNAVVESLACGTPVIVSDQVDVGRNLHDAVVTSVPRDVSSIASAIELWLSNTELRARSFAECRRIAREQFEWSRIANRWVLHYEGIVSAINRLCEH